MIQRYSSQEMRDLWDLKAKFEHWKNIEIYACEYWNQEGKIPNSDLKDIVEKAQFSVERILEIEAEVHHDVIAFLTNMAEHIGPASRYVHFGMTSSDVGDTALTALIQQAGEIIAKSFEKLLEALYKKSVELKDQLVVGRTHGVHAEPTTLGLKLLGYYSECKRNYERLLNAFEECSYGKISGAVGSYSQLPPELEEYVLKKMNLKVEPISTQVIPRDRHAFLMNQISLSAQGLSRLAQEIRLMQKSESREIEEPFQKGQKGSSAMPHKRNPILCERICGLSRVLLGYSQTAQQNIGLWHERDISHSSAERIIFPDATSLFEYMLQKMTFVVENLTVYPENCDSVLNETRGLLYSSRALLVITETLAMVREDAYKIVQTAAMQVWADRSLSLRGLLAELPALEKITSKQWDEVFDPLSFLHHVDTIFARFDKPKY